MAQAKQEAFRKLSSYKHQHYENGIKLIQSWHGKKTFQDHWASLNSYE
jgi:hypothetical protein